MLQIKRHLKTDSVGIALSLLCLAHCVLLTGAVAVGVVGGQSLLEGALTDSSDLAHQLLLLAVIPVSGLALVGGWLRHRRHDILLIGGSGMALLALAAFFAHDHLGHTTDTIITIVGSLMLGYAHWRNRTCGCSGRSATPAVPNQTG